MLRLSTTFLCILFSCGIAFSNSSNSAVGPEPCQFTADYDPLGFGQYYFWVNPDNPDWTISWDFDDGTDIVFGNNIVHEFYAPGTYEIQVWVQGLECGDGQPFLLILEVGYMCEAFFQYVVNGNQVEFYNGSYYDDPLAFAFWDFGDGTVSDNPYPSHVYEIPGEYQVCLEIIGEFTSCSYCETIVVQGEPDCELLVELHDEGCNFWITEAYNYPENAQIFWQLDGETYGEGPSYSYLLLEPGPHQICAFYETPECPEAVFWCETVIVIENSPQCPNQFFVDEAEECGAFIFGYDLGENAEISWSFGDGTEGYGALVDHQYTEPGEYLVCSWYYSPDCVCGSDICQTIVVPECDECPTDLWAQAQEGDPCGIWLFEIGSFVEGESVVWDFGDGSGEEGGHFTQHFYSEPGEYQVCGFYTSPLCPEGVTICEWIYVEPCGECTEIWIQFETNLDLNGPGNVSWQLVGGDYAINGACGFQPGYQECNIFDCIPNGCYTLSVFPYPDPIFDENFQVYVEIGGQEILLEGPNPLWNEGYEFNFSYNAECDFDCTLGMEIYEEGCNLFVSQAFDYPEGTTISWLINGEYAGQGELWTWQLEPGEYEICAAYETPDCPFGAIACETIVVGGNEECPSDLFYAPGQQCGYYVFEVFEFVEGEDVMWDFGDGTSINGGHYAEHFYEEPGTYTVCAWYYSPLCECGIDICIELVYEPCEAECTDVGFGIDITPQEGEGIVSWAVFGNDYFQEGLCEYEPGQQFCDFTHCLPDGCYNISIWPSIQNLDEIEIIINVNGETITPELIYIGDVVMTYQFGINNDCSQNCPEEILVSEGYECGVFEFWIPNEDLNPTVQWFVDGVYYGGGDEITFAFNEPGVHTVCVSYFSELCQGTELCVNVEVEECNGYCPDEIWADANDQEGYCDVWFFEIGEFVEGEEVTWFYGDGFIEDGGHFTSHIYEESGEYLVCAYYTSPLCPDGMEICTWIYVDLDCLDACPDDIWADNQEGDCNMWLFEIGSFQEGEEVHWNFGDGTEQVGGHFIQHEYEESGEYYVCGFFTSNDCPDGVEICTWIYVNVNCQDECPEEMWADAQEGEPCGIWLFEIGSFVEGEQVVWDFGDGSEEVGGHFTQHFYEEPGEYLVCGFYTSPQCPNGTTICTWIYVPPCGDDCSEVGFAFDSFINEGGPEYTHWAILQDGQVIEDGVCEYSIGQPHCDAIVCLPDGCYDVWMWGDFGDSYEGFFSAAFLDGEQLPIVSGPESCGEECFTYTFSLNGECEDETECDLDLVYDQIDENTFIFFAEPSDPEANIWWDFGDGEFVDGAIQTYQFPGPGTYEVCAFYETPDCPFGVEDCVIIVIEGDECNLVTINFSAEFDDSDIELLEWILEGQDIEFDGDLILGLVDVDFSATFCVPDGCYEFSMVAIDGIFDLLGIEIEVIYNDEVIALEEWIDGDTINFQFGVNDDCETSVGETDAATALVYPNPTRDILNISFDRNMKNVSLDLYDMSGKLIHNETVNGNSAEIRLPNLAVGLYTLRLANDNILQVSKIEITK